MFPFGDGLVEEVNESVPYVWPQAEQLGSGDPIGPRAVGEPVERPFEFLDGERKVGREEALNNI